MGRVNQNWMKWIFLCGIFSGFLCLSLGYAQQKEQAELTNYLGTVEVMLKDSDEYVSAQEGMILVAQDKIKTRDSSCVELSFNEDNTNVVRLEGNTVVTISLSGDGKLEMTAGEVFVSLGKLSQESVFEIRTPSAVSGARGTEWVTKVTEGQTDVEAISGQPYVIHFEDSGTLSQERTTVFPGQMTTVRKLERPMQARPMAEEHVQKLRGLGQEMRKRANLAIQQRQNRPPFNRQNFIEKMKERKAERSNNQNRPKGMMMLDSGSPGASDRVPGDGAAAGQGGSPPGQN